jgi:hypothetical protein
MVVDIINKTLTTQLLSKFRYGKPTEPFYFLYFDGHFMKTRNQHFFGKVDEMEPKFFYPLNCFKAYKKSFL